MRAATYRILDEPAPGTLARFAVSPFWPLLAMMMAGVWLAAPWFAWNGFALGSATKKSEAWLAGASLVLPIPLLYLAELLFEALAIPESRGPYVYIVLTGIKLIFAYAIWFRQERSSALYTYYGGALRNGAMPLIAGVVVRMAVFAYAPMWLKLLFWI